MQKITPVIWFEENIERAAKLYAAALKGEIVDVTRYGEGMPLSKGKVLTMTLDIGGERIMLLNGGQYAKPNPAISFLVGCATVKELDGMWKKLADGGSVMMPLGKYPFAERYGWVQDRFGVSWQLMLGKRKQKITPCLMYCGAAQGKAADAITHYVSVFKKARLEMAAPYEKGETRMKAKLKHALFTLEGQQFAAMDSGVAQEFTFTPALSLLVEVRTQAEIDRLWKGLLRGGGKEWRCGWLADRFGVSWQVAPVQMGKMIAGEDPEKTRRAMQAMMRMKKLDLKKLQQAYWGK